MPDTDRTQLRIADLSNRKPTRFDLTPNAPAREALAAELEILGVKKARLQGVLTPRGKSDWVLEAQMGATVVQACAITLEPVTTRIEEAVNRHFLADYEEIEGDEIEMTIDDTIDPLPQVIDLMLLLSEALSLALPPFPRAEGAQLGEAVFTQAGSKPMTDDDAKPFAGLDAFKKQLEGDTD